MLATHRRRCVAGVQAGGHYAERRAAVSVTLILPIAVAVRHAIAISSHSVHLCVLCFASELAGSVAWHRDNAGAPLAHGRLASVVLVRRLDRSSMRRRLESPLDRRLARQRGLARGGVVGLIALGCLMVAAALALHAVTSAPPAPRVALSAASAASAQSKVESFKGAGQQAAQRGQPVVVTETFSDSELSSYANQQAAAHGLAFGDIRLHAASGGSIEGAATIRVAGRSLPLELAVVPLITADNRLQIHLSKVALGSLPLPGPLADQINRSLSQSLDLAAFPSGLRNVQLRVAEGQVTISGVVEPKT